MSRRAQRRHHFFRIRKRRRNYWGGITKPKHRNMVVKTPHPCSCPICGNQRRHTGQPTLQERKASLDFKDELEELDSISPQFEELRGLNDV